MKLLAGENREAQPTTAAEEYYNSSESLEYAV